MAIEFRCEKCGKLLSVDAEPGSTTRCPHCGKKVAVPAVLASLPQPQIPNGAAPATVAAPPPPPGEEGLEEEAEGGGDAVMGAMANIMPWVISVFFHVGLALIMGFVTMILVQNTMPDDIIVPSDMLSETPGGVINPGESNPDKQARQPTKTTSMGESQRDNSIPADSGKTDNQLMLIGSASGGASGGTLAPFGNSKGGTGAGPRSNFLGLGGNAHHICYVIDRSGSMTESFDIVRREMLISISRLSPKQDFHVILFSKGNPLEPGARRLVPATPRYKEDAAAFLDGVNPSGQTDPIPALERAFNVLSKADTRNNRKGKLIFLLTDGDFPDNNAVLRSVRDLNVKKDVYINTYLYGSKGKQVMDVMMKIADENNGRFKAVAADE